MDLSKIPGSSPSAATPTGTAQPPPPPVIPVKSDTVRDPIPAADSYFAIAIGALLILIFPRFLQYVSHVLFKTYFAPFLMPDGTEVSYLSQRVFISDLAIFAFGGALVLEGLLRVVAGHKRWVYYTAATVIGGATVLNAFVLITQFQYGLPLVSALAVIFGGYATVTLFNHAKS